MGAVGSIRLGFLLEQLLVRELFVFGSGGGGEGRYLIAGHCGVSWLSWPGSDQ